MAKASTFRLASSSDAASLLSIIEETDFKGKISLLYTRRPDAYASLQKEGRTVFIYLCENGNTAAGFGACSVNDVYVDGKIAACGYLFSFRVKKEFPSTLKSFPDGYQFHFESCKPHQVDTFLTTILSENTEAIRLLEKKRASMPVYGFIGEITTYSLVTGKKYRLQSGREFRKATDADKSALLYFLNEEGKAYQYFPVLTLKDLETGTCSPKLEDFYLLKDKDGVITACGAVWDQRNFKQYIAAGYKGLYSLLRPISRWLFPLLGLPALPPKGETLNFFALSFFVCKKNLDWPFEAFLRCIGSQMKEYSFYSFGLHDSNPQKHMMKNFRCLKYKSRLYRVGQRGQNLPVFSGIPYIEIGRL
jgi:hypothetical protein